MSLSKFPAPGRMLDFCSPSKDGPQRFSANDGRAGRSVSWESDTLGRVESDASVAKSGNSFMDLWQNYCQPKPLLEREQWGESMEGSAGLSGARSRSRGEENASAGASELPSYSSLFSATDESARGGKAGKKFKPPQSNSVDEAEGYSWEEAAEQLRQQRRQNFEQDAFGNLVPKAPKRTTSSSSQAAQFEKLTKEVCTSETEKARARRAVKVSAEHATSKRREMRHSGDYRVHHIKSSTTPAPKGYKTLVEGQELSPFHSLMENLRVGLGGARA